MNMNRFLFLSVLLLPAVALAQPTAQPPAPLQQLPEGHAPVDEEALRRVFQDGAQRVAEVVASEDVPAGVIEVLVVDEAGVPLANVPVRLGLLARGQSAGARHLRTAANGRGRFTDIPREAAGRVYVEHEGARYGTPPIQMQPGTGQLVTIHRLPTTPDPRVLLQRVGRTIVEWKTDRVRITQLVELLNFGTSTFVFAQPGLFYPLPEGTLAFEADRAMNDLRLTKTSHGFRISGSLPPGTAQMSWHYDLPLHGETFSFRQGMPFPQTVAYQLVVVAADGMELDATGFPPAEQVTYEGREYLVSESERTPQDPPMGEIRFSVTGIPGPGPYRYIAIGLAVLALVWAGYVATRRGSSATVHHDERERARVALLAEVDALARKKAAGELGDAYFARERDRLVEELALLEHAERV